MSSTSDLSRTGTFFRIALPGIRNYIGSNQATLGGRMEEPTTPTYEPPKIDDYGDLFDMTATLATGISFDKTFPAGVPGPGTFS